MSILAFISAFFAISLGLLVLWREHRAMAPWTFSLGMIIFGIEEILAEFSTMAATPVDAAHWQGMRLTVLSFLPSIWLCFSLTYARGNTRNMLFQSRLWLVFALIIPVTIALTTRDHLSVAAILSGAPQQWVIALGISGVLLNIILLLSSVLIIMNLERTYRAAIGTMRWRIKFMILGVGTLFVVRAYTSVQNLVFHAIVPSLQTFNTVGLIVAALLILRSIFRTGNFDVTVYPSQSLLRSSITIVISGIYLILIGLLAKWTSFFGENGTVSFPEKAFFILILLVLFSMLLLSDRFRLYTKLFVSRHFQRSLYDYRSVWRHFTEATTSRMNQTDLCRAVVRLIADQFQALSVSIWTFDYQKQNLTLAASTFLLESKGNELAPRGNESAEIMKAVRACPEPISIEHLNENWAAVLRKCHPNQFPEKGSRLCVPMISGGEVTGIMTLGDRVGGLAFVQQDFDLLNCIGDQLAANLRNLQLSHKLLQVKELEAFQSMSAFFVHDLKNTASTLGLMLQNLPIHFHDPAFREDALRGISKTVDHINQLINRLGSLRQGLLVKPGEADLNATVVRILNALPQSPGIEIIQQLTIIPKLQFDQEQVGKVITNLLLNAFDAVGKNGVIRIETFQKDDWGILCVKDNGCGMNAEFLSQSLFRPFQTTKKNGLGIGMFQSKMIMEAHGGRIEVESEIGKGTTFSILLPLSKGIA